MDRIEIGATMSTTAPAEQLLQAIDEIEVTELRRVVSEVLARASKRLAPSLSFEETELLKKINRGLPQDLHLRVRELDAKRREERLSDTEHEELLRLIGQVEGAQVKRLEHLVALAQVRGTTLPKLMAELGLEPPPIA